jgi:hypothetical protein
MCVECCCLILTWACMQYPASLQYVDGVILDLASFAKGQLVSYSILYTPCTMSSMLASSCCLPCFGHLRVVLLCSSMGTHVPVLCQPIKLVGHISKKQLCLRPLLCFCRRHGVVGMYASLVMKLLMLIIIVLLHCSGTRPMALMQGHDLYVTIRSLVM